MKKTLSCILLLMLLHVSLRAQHYRGYRGFDNSYHSVSELGRHEIRLGIGIFSTDQIKDISTREQTKFDFPKSIPLLSPSDIVFIRSTGWPLALLEPLTTNRAIPVTIPKPTPTSSPALTIVAHGQVPWASRLRMSTRITSRCMLGSKVAIHCTMPIPTLLQPHCTCRKHIPAGS